MTNPVFILPETMQAMFALNKPTEDKLPLRLRKLVHLRASQINGCSVCVDMHAKELQKDGTPLEHIFAVAAWRETPYFSDAERAALELTESLTRIADRPDPVPDAVWEKVTRHFSEPEIAALLVSIALINSWNRFNVAVKMMVGDKWEKAA
ncbi:MAG TPA: carboxymuconolactone decarboxylase family protein [Rhizomicrobium sp.]|jgi:AhpD family alkylhydroperoxidase|nr:carboxymuconolactone decarboxylase family protein [Rhizomicrobium sp.]